MLLTQNIENLTQWVQENICSQIELLKPDDSQMGSDYEVQYVHPKAFSMYIPAKDCLPPDADTKLPAVCIQLVDGNDDLTINEETLHIRLSFAIWNPGTYEEIKDSNGNTVGEQVLKMNADGWKDAWLFLEKAKRIIQKQMYIEGMKVDRKEPVKFGFFTNDSTMVNVYPEWYAWMSFALKYGLSANPGNDVQQYL